MDVKEQQLVDHASQIRPCWGERVSGDTIVIRPIDDGLLFAIVDVLGHGPDAHELTHVIEAYLDRYPSHDVCGLMSRMHQHLKGTRGAAVGLCALNTETGCLRYAGIGNTVMRRFGSGETRFVSQDGVLGQNMRTPRMQEIQLEPGDLIVLYTDGISDRFTVDNYPGILQHPPAQVTETLIQRFGKSHDDAGCIAARYHS